MYMVSAPAAASLRKEEGEKGEKEGKEKGKGTDAFRCQTRTPQKWRLSPFYISVSVALRPLGRLWRFGRRGGSGVLGSVPSLRHEPGAVTGGEVDDDLPYLPFNVAVGGPRTSFWICGP